MNAALFQHNWKTGVKGKLYVLGCKYSRNGASMLIDMYVPALNSPSHVPSLILGSCKEGTDRVGLRAGEWPVICLISCVIHV